MPPGMLTRTRLAAAGSPDLPPRRPGHRHRCPPGTRATREWRSPSRSSASLLRAPVWHSPACCCWGFGPATTSDLCSPSPASHWSSSCAMREVAFAGGAEGWVPAAVWLSLHQRRDLVPAGDRPRPAALSRRTAGLASVGLASCAASSSWRTRAVPCSVRSADGPLLTSRTSAQSEGDVVRRPRPRRDRRSALSTSSRSSPCCRSRRGPLARRPLSRRSGADDRQRIKPLGLAALVIVAGLLLPQLLPGLHRVGIARVRRRHHRRVATGSRCRRAALPGLGPGTGVIMPPSSTRDPRCARHRRLRRRGRGGLGGCGFNQVVTPELAPSVVATALVAVLFGPTKQYLERAAKRSWSTASGPARTPPC